MNTSIPGDPKKAPANGPLVESPSTRRGNSTCLGSSNVSHSSASLAALLKRIPEGWTLARYAGRPYGLTRTTRVDGRSISISAEELGGSGLISANVYRTVEADHLRPCEMPEAKVLAFLRGWVPA